MREAYGVSAIETDGRYLCTCDEFVIKDLAILEDSRSASKQLEQLLKSKMAFDLKKPSSYVPHMRNGWQIS